MDERVIEVYKYKLQPISSDSIKIMYDDAYNFIYELSIDKDCVYNILSYTKFHDYRKDF